MGTLIAKVGRPTKYKPEHCEAVIEFGRSGLSKAQIASRLDVAKSTMRDWEKKHPEFAQALEDAHYLALAWWEDKGMSGQENKSFNATMYIFQMKNRFREEYRDVNQTELTGKDGAPIVMETNEVEAARRVSYMLGVAMGKIRAASPTP